MAHYDSFGVAPVRTSCCFHSLCAFTCCDIQCVFCFSGCRTARTRTAAASPYCWSSRDCFPDSTPTSALMQGNIDELNRLLKLISVCLLYKTMFFVDTTCCFSCREAGSLTTKARNAGWRTTWITRVRILLHYISWARLF